jgi:hypothetical protein
VSKPVHLPASSEASLRGVSEHLRFARGLSPGSRTQADPRGHHRLAQDSESALSISASFETSLWRRSPIGTLETPCDVTHVLASAQPDKPRMTRVKSPRHRL